MNDIDAKIETGAVFRAAELKAEGLVGVMRMLVAVGLGVFLLMAAAASDPPQRAVLERQWFYAALSIAGYMALGGFAWIAVRKEVFRGWMVWVLATGDCIFILAGVWQGLHNTGLPGNFGFVFPAIWLVPLVMSFSALRFDPLVPLYVAVLLIGGIIAIEAYIPAGDGPVNMNMVDLFLGGPPTFMRLVMLTMACLIMALAAFRARRLLLRALTEQHRTANLVRYLPRQLAPQLAEGKLDELRRGIRQNVGILFVDMRGFTTLSEGMSPQGVTELVTEYRKRITRAAHGTGGMIDKFMGDAALVVFPEGEDAGVSALACLTCAERLAWDIDDWGAERGIPVRIGIGIHWGSVFCGVVGDAERLEYSIFGDAVNTAARLEELTKAEKVQIIASRDLLDRAGLSGEPKGWQVLTQRSLRGRTGEIEILGRSLQLNRN